MQSIFKDERHRNGAFSRGPERVGPKPALTASTILESALHFLAVVSWSAPVSDANAFPIPYGGRTLGRRLRLVSGKPGHAGTATLSDEWP